MEFSSARVDSLVRRLLSVGEMMETFEGRSDFLYYRHVQFTEDDIDPEEQLVEVLFLWL